MHMKQLVLIVEDEFGCLVIILKMYFLELYLLVMQKNVLDIDSKLFELGGRQSNPSLIDLLYSDSNQRILT